MFDTWLASGSPFGIADAVPDENAMPPRAAIPISASGGVAGVLGADQRPRFRSYVVEQRCPSYRYQGDVRVGAELPEAGVTYYEVPQEYGVREYRYTVVNDRPVLVDPRTRRIVEVIE
jgi:Protein of unknown function (DUF1236)